MGTTLSYSGIVTKARAMESRLLSKEDYEKIANMESVAEFISFLKGRQGYGRLFEGREENSFHRNEIEELLVYSVYQDYAKLYSFSGKEQRKALELMFWRMETDLLKECLHQIVGGRKRTVISGFVKIVEKYSGADTQALKQAETIEQYMAALKGSAYENVFQKLEENNQLNFRDMAERLDIYCFTRIWKAIDKNFAGKEKKALKDIYGKQIDLLNIMWIYRTKKYYGGSELNEMPELIPVCYRLRQKQLQELAGCYSSEEFLSALEKTYYSQIPKEVSIEQFYRDSLAHAYQENKKKYPYSMSPVYSVLYKKMREINRLTTALECIRYQLEAGNAIQYIMQG